ncbi:MAG TPA: fumarylacetoacetate hydrolase family protein [Terriglobia bacterium]|nr:fumarylacetoacetate hydrolase family protein [Terriglobia bacterium]
MKFVTYEFARSLRLGVVEVDYVVDVQAALGMFARGRMENPKTAKAVATLRKAGPPPLDMIELLGRGKKYWSAFGVITECLGQSTSGRKKARNLYTPLASARLRAPIQRPGKIVCVGLNYADHAREQGIEAPSFPTFFLKSVNTISGPGAPIVMPPNSTQVDYEAEFAVVIGKGGRRIPEDRAYDHVAGYMNLNDVTARDMQHGDKQWFRGKSCDTFAPTGPWILTADEVADPHNLRISLTLNGQTMQDSNTSNLIHKVPFLISYLSQSLTWETGDILTTGTPSGVGVFRKPPIFLNAGDTVSATVEGLGTLTNTVAGPS